MVDLPALLAALGDQFAGVRATDVTRYTAGKTFGVRAAERQLDLVVKVNTDARCLIFGANRLVSDHFAREKVQEIASQVVQVLAYDARKRTPHEILIMQRSEGRMLLDDLLTISRADLESVVRDVLVCSLLRRLHSAHFKDSKSEQWDWGKFCEDIRPEHQLRHMPALSSYHISIFQRRFNKIRDRKSEDDNNRVPEYLLEQLECYFSTHAHVFDHPVERPVLVHTDVHWANIQ